MQMKSTTINGTENAPQITRESDKTFTLFLLRKLCQLLELKQTIKRLTERSRYLYVELIKLVGCTRL